MFIAIDYIYYLFAYVYKKNISRKYFNRLYFSGFLKMCFHKQYKTPSTVKKYFQNVN